MALLSEVLLICMQGLWTSAKLCVHNLVQRVGFFGILLAASVSASQTLSILAGSTLGCECLVLSSRVLAAIYNVTAKRRSGDFGRLSWARKSIAIA